MAELTSGTWEKRALSAEAEVEGMKMANLQRNLLLLELGITFKNRGDVVEVCNQRAADAYAVLRKFVHWYEVDSTEENRDVAFYEAKKLLEQFPEAARG